MRMVFRENTSVKAQQPPFDVTFKFTGSGLIFGSATNCTNFSSWLFSSWVMIYFLREWRKLWKHLISVTTKEPKTHFFQFYTCIGTEGFRIGCPQFQCKIVKISSIFLTADQTVFRSSFFFTESQTNELSLCYSKHFTWMSLLIFYFSNWNVHSYCEDVWHDFILPDN